jgi:hypothetical protein
MPRNHLHAYSHETFLSSPHHKYMYMWYQSFWNTLYNDSQHCIFGSSETQDDQPVASRVCFQLAASTPITEPGSLRHRFTTSSALHSYQFPVFSPQVLVVKGSNLYVRNLPNTVKYLLIFLNESMIQRPRVTTSSCHQSTE